MIGRFVICEHHATSLHYDLRLEIEGVLKSWAVPKGLTLDATDVRLAIETNDHNLSHLTFEGTRRRGLYGAGEVCIWDRGYFEAAESISVDLSKGKFSFHYPEQNSTVYLE